MRVNIGPYPKGQSRAKRRIDVRIDPYDTWNLDSTLAHIILPALRQLKKQKDGSPGQLFDCSHHTMEDWDSPEFKAAERKSSREGHAKWATLLDEMIWSFSQVVRWYPNEPRSKDREAFDAYHDRVANGFKLFGQWYQSLWT